jgi:predicted acyl esterase
VRAGTAIRAAIAGPLALAALALGAPPAGAEGYSVKTLHFDVTTGPNDDQHCDIVGDLYKPDSATHANPAPAILTTNGFGGSKDDQADIGKLAASRGYVVLSYSGLGFGGSGCKITLDDRDYDGKAGSQLVTFLGGGKAATDGTRVDYVKLDATAHDGLHHDFDPRVGMIGGSYGGQIQFAIAGIDPRVDTIIPIITWSDLAYSLAPNNTSFSHGVTYDTPGVEKAEWTSLFFGLGIVDGLEGANADPSRNVGCPNFDNRACGSKVQMDATGAPNDATLLFARHASVESFVNDIHIPTLLAQGQGDTLFDLQEAIATYRSLRAQNVPVKMIWQSWGHSSGTPAPGEEDFTNPGNSYEVRTFLQWFDHYLADAPSGPPLDVTYFRDWVSYNGDATAAYARADAYPFAATSRLYLSGSNALVSAPGQVAAGSAAFTTPAAGAPTSYTETSAVDQSSPVTDAPGTFAEFTGQPLASDLDVIGVPTADVTVSAPTFENAASAAGAPGELVLFFKLYDIKPDGTVVLAHRVISPVRIADFTHQVHVELPGIVHRFAKGDRIALTVSASDAAYRGNNTPGPVTIATDPARPSVVTLPVVPAAQQLPVTASALAPSVTAIQNGFGVKGPCVDRRKFAFRVHQPRNGRVVAARVYVNGKLVKSVRGHRIRRVVVRRLPQRTFTVKIVAVTNRHSRTVSVRVYRACTKGRPHTRVRRGHHKG